MTEKKYNTQYLDILHLIVTGKDTASKLSKALRTPYTTITSRLARMVKANLIYKETAFNVRPYKLTQCGKVYITKFSSTLGKARSKGLSRIHAHKVCWYFEISRAPADLRDQLRKHAFSVSMHKTWPKYSKKLYEDAKIVFNPNKVYVYTEEMFLNSPMEYYDKAMTRLEEIRKDLQDRFPKLVLGSPNKKMVVESNHIVKQYGPLALKFYEESIKTGERFAYHGKNLDIDFSKGPPEEETKSKLQAPAHMDFLGHFFDELLDKPFTVDQFHETNRETKEVKQLVKAQSKIQTETTSQLGQLVDTHDAFNKEIKQILKSQSKMIHGQSKMIFDQSKIQTETTSQLGQLIDAHDVFATAMQEHVTLVKALQGVAVKTKAGMDNQAQAIVQFSKALASHGKALKGQGRAIMDQGKVLQQALMMIIEIQKPWYMKAWEKVKKRGWKLWP